MSKVKELQERFEREGITGFHLSPDYQALAEEVKGMTRDEVAESIAAGVLRSLDDIEAGRVLPHRLDDEVEGCCGPYCDCYPEEAAKIREVIGRTGK